jgi:post-segregation antitoxin (ccd killing protein)
MKQKLTITVEGELVPRAKRYARSRGVSLSSLIETELRGLVSDEASSFASRWRGEFKAAERQDGRYEALAKKYL